MTDQNLRVEALSRAIDTSRPGENALITLERAKAFYDFLCDQREGTSE